ncbi:hypothetical protein M9H77_36190 [Catharanthus roseus]|uniref:Uncharacterized protein n=1 Tax=Catharanthus roseus TaxID=4058 RepID=A0ACB9ZUU5_CATRO|nr:hypothetical protein M9H77_36190 [Catharanthus roseus]
MEAINPIRVILFWDCEIARDAYGPHFTGVLRKSWTLPTNRMISHDQLVKKILKYRDMDPNSWNVRMTMRVPSYYEHEQRRRNALSMDYSTPPSEERDSYSC